MRKRVLLAVALLLVVGAVADASRAPANQVSTSLAVAGIQTYQRHVSPALSRLGASCRFTPSCSHYAEAVLKKHGIVAGGWMAAGRILRCGPWTPTGTVDPPR